MDRQSSSSQRGVSATAGSSGRRTSTSKGQGAHRDVGAPEAGSRPTSVSEQFDEAVTRGIMAAQRDVRFVETITEARNPRRRCRSHVPNATGRLTNRWPMRP